MVIFFKLRLSRELSLGGFCILNGLLKFIQIGGSQNE